MYTNDGNDGPLSEDTLWVAVVEKILGRHETRAYNLDDEGTIEFSDDDDAVKSLEDEGVIESSSGDSATEFTDDVNFQDMNVASPSNPSLSKYFKPLYSVAQRMPAVDQ